MDTPASGYRFYITQHLSLSVGKLIIVRTSFDRAFPDDELVSLSSYLEDPHRFAIHVAISKQPPFESVATLNKALVEAGIATQRSILSRHNEWVKVFVNYYGPK